jgi:hypothetical protein
MAPSKSMKDENVAESIATESLYSHRDMSFRHPIAGVGAIASIERDCRILRQQVGADYKVWARNRRSLPPVPFFFTTQRIGVNRDDQDRLFRAFLLSLNPRRVYIGPVAFGAAGSRRKNANKLVETL